MKLVKQIAVLVLLAAFFASFDIFLYNVFTKRYVSDKSSSFKAKSIELDQFLPFEEESQAHVIDTELCLSGDLPVIDGAAALYPVFSSIVGSVYPENAVEFDGTDFTENSALQMNNTPGAFERIVTGEDDLIFCAFPSEAQLDYAAENGVELVLVPVGREGFVFFVNENNPVDNLTADQIRGIYSGRIRNWSEVGGNNELISPLRRNPGSGSQTVMDWFMNGEEIPLDYDAVLGKAIAFSFRYYVSELADYGGIKILSVEGVYPSEENLRTNTYPLTSDFYAIYRAGDDNPNIPILLDWILSDDGQELIEANGYISLQGEG